MSNKRDMRPTAKMRWLQIHGSDLGSNHPSAIRQGELPFFMVLQQWWIPTSDEPDDWKAWEAGEWHDIPIELPKR